MNDKFSLTCAYCARRQAPEAPAVRCAACDGPLVVNTDLAPFLGAGHSAAVPHEAGLPGWRA